MKTCPRDRRKKYPPGIDPSKLPNNCNFDPRGKGRWYISYKDDAGKRKTCTVGDSTLSIADLHQFVEKFFLKETEDRESFQWLAEQYQKSIHFKALSKSTQKQYNTAYKNVSKIQQRSGKSLAESARAKWNTPLIQQIIEKIAENSGPTSAKHAKQYLSVLFKFGLRSGYCKTDPVVAIKLPKERKRQRLPDHVLIGKLLNFAQHDSNPHYLWLFLEVAYLCRLRGIELREMTEDQILDRGLECRRAKGSKTNITEWNDRLRLAINHALKTRDAIWQKQKRPVNFHAKDRLVFVNRCGDKISASGWQSVWRRFLNRAIEKGIMTEAEKFGLHDMKRRGATDTRGTKEEKLDATGHSSRQQLAVYDKEVAVVKPAGD